MQGEPIVNILDRRASSEKASQEYLVEHPWCCKSISDRIDEYKRAEVVPE